MQEQYVPYTVNSTVRLISVVCLCVFATAIIFPQSVSANQALIAKLQIKQTELRAVNDDLDRAKIGYESSQIELETARSKLSSLKANTDREKKKLDKFRDAEAQFPDLDFSEKISAQVLVWKSANKEYLSNKQYVASLESRVRDYKSKYDITQRKKATLESSVNRISNDLAGAEVNAKLRTIRKSKRIRVSARETCSLSVTKDQCRDRARIKAEREAAEKGAIVVVDSVTEVKNFNLTRDEARSRVTAQVSDITVIKDTFDLTADKTGWQVQYEISALVTPVITDKMRNELRQQAIANIGGGGAAAIGTSSGRSGSPSYQPAAYSRPSAAQTRQNKAAVRREAEQELEHIRQEASRVAEAEATRQAREEAKSKRRAFGAW